MLNIKVNIVVKLIMFVPKVATNARILAKTLQASSLVMELD